ncbi:MAG: phosphoribosyltransferase family protein [Verrucomicrobiota bacterium]
MSRFGSQFAVVGNSSDDPFAIDVAFTLGQQEDVADVISLKQFGNKEFCPRFISDEGDFAEIGNKLAGRQIIIVSTSNQNLSRQCLAMRNFMIARAAKENGAAEVTLVEPDLYYSAQDRGPRQGLGEPGVLRDEKDLKKFDGQPFTSKLYAEMLKISGVDRVVTVHNHSHSVQAMFSDVFGGKFHNLIPYDIYIDYLRNSNIVNYGPLGEGLVLCAPDEGARPFVEEIYRRINLPSAKFLTLDKERTGEHKVEIKLHRDCEVPLESISGHELVLFDDMVRSGSTVVKACQFLRRVDLKRAVFALTHFHASDDGRMKMANTAIDEILTLNTIPTILNRDTQGRLRKKLVVLKIEKWLALQLGEILGITTMSHSDGFYQIDMSSKNARWRRKIWSNDELRELKTESISA